MRKPHPTHQTLSGLDESTYEVLGDSTILTSDDEDDGNTASLTSGASVDGRTPDDLSSLAGTEQSHEEHEEQDQEQDHPNNEEESFENVSRHEARGDDAETEYTTTDDEDDGEDTPLVDESELTTRPDSPEVDIVMSPSMRYEDSEPVQTTAAMYWSEAKRFYKELLVELGRIDRQQWPLYLKVFSVIVASLVATVLANWTYNHVTVTVTTKKSISRSEPPVTPSPLTTFVRVPDHEINENVREHVDKLLRAINRSPSPSRSTVSTMKETQTPTDEPSLAKELQVISKITHERALALANKALIVHQEITRAIVSHTGIIRAQAAVKCVKASKEMQKEAGKLAQVVNTEVTRFVNSISVARANFDPAQVVKDMHDFQAKVAHRAHRNAMSIMKKLRKNREAREAKKAERKKEDWKKKRLAEIEEAVQDRLDKINKGEKKMEAQKKWKLSKLEEKIYGRVKTNNDFESTKDNNNNNKPKTHREMRKEAKKLAKAARRKIR